MKLMTAESRTLLLHRACLSIQPVSYGGVSNTRRRNPVIHDERVQYGQWNIIVHLYQLQHNEGIIYKGIKDHYQIQKDCIVQIPLAKQVCWSGWFDGCTWTDCLYPTGWGLLTSRAGWILFMIARGYHCYLRAHYIVSRIRGAGYSWEYLLASFDIIITDLARWDWILYISHVRWFSLSSFHLFLLDCFLDVLLHAVLGVILANALSSVLLGPWIIWLRRIIPSSWSTLQ